MHNPLFGGAPPRTTQYNSSRPHFPVRDVACFGRNEHTYRCIPPPPRCYHNGIGCWPAVLRGCNLSPVQDGRDKHRVFQEMSAKTSQHISKITGISRPATQDTQPQNDQAPFSWRLCRMHQIVWYNRQLHNRYCTLLPLCTRSSKNHCC